MPKHKEATVHLGPSDFALVRHTILGVPEALSFLAQTDVGQQMPGLSRLQTRVDQAIEVLDRALKAALAGDPDQEQPEEGED